METVHLSTLQWSDTTATQVCRQVAKPSNVIKIGEIGHENGVAHESMTVECYIGERPLAIANVIRGRPMITVWRAATGVVDFEPFPADAGASKRNTPAKQ